MLVVESFILLQYEPTEVVGKPLRISDGETRLADHRRAGVPHSHHMSGLNYGEEAHNLNQAAQNLRRGKVNQIS